MSESMDDSLAAAAPELAAPPAPLPHTDAADGGPTPSQAADESIMAPEASPWRTSKPNRRPIIVLAVVCVAFAVFVAYAVLNRYAESNTDTSLSAASSDMPVLPRGTDSRRMADDIIGTPRVGLIPGAGEPQEPPPAVADVSGTEKAPVPIAPVNDDPPRPPPRPTVERSAASQAEDEQWRQQRLSALREALVAPRTVHFDRRAAAEPPQDNFVDRERARVAQLRASLNGGPTDPATAYQQAAAQAAQLLGVPPGAAQALPMGGPASAAMAMPGAPPGASASSDSRNSLRGFASRDSERWQLPTQVEDPASPYMVQVGSVIEAVLDSAVNSELPGSLLGHVASPVYSSTGNHELLIPEGTKVFGQYSADVVFGQDRLLVAWQLLRFPNGKTLDIGAMPGTDGVGRSGLEDQVDHHYLRIFGSALLLSVVTTGVTATQSPGSGADRISAGSAMSQALGLQFGQVTAQLLQKNLNIAPTIEIRNGFRFNIVVTKHLTFRGPYPHI